MNSTQIQNLNKKHTLEYTVRLDGKFLKNGKRYFYLTLNVGTPDQKLVCGFSLKQVAYNYGKEFGFAKYNKLLAMLPHLHQTETGFGKWRDPAFDLS